MEGVNQFYKDKIVVITGAGGYIGGQLVSELQKTEAQIIRVSSQDLSPLDGVTSLKFDIKTRHCWNEIADKADIIFHLAGNTSVYAAAKDPLGSLSSTLVPIVYMTFIKYLLKNNYFLHQKKVS
jgi:nucleoside-diphosphate-sugar epimerase